MGTTVNNHKRLFWSVMYKRWIGHLEKLTPPILLNLDSPVKWQSWAITFSFFKYFFFQYCRCSIYPFEGCVYVCTYPLKKPLISSCPPIHLWAGSGGSHTAELMCVCERSSILYTAFTDNTVITQLVLWCWLAGCEYALMPWSVLSMRTTKRTVVANNILYFAVIMIPQLCESHFILACRASSTWLVWYWCN